jgi:hypothetical protein
MIDRSEVNRALAKAIAYKQCGKDRDAAIWAEKLVRLLECAEILNDNLRPLGVVGSERAE